VDNIYNNWPIIVERKCIIMNEKIMAMSDEDLKTAFEEFSAHERTQVLQDGIIRDLIKEISKNDKFTSYGVLIISVEYALLKEMARRFYMS